MTDSERPKTLRIGESVDSRQSTYREPFGVEQLPEDLLKIINERSSVRGRKKPINVLEEKHMLSIILYVDSMSPVIKNDIQNNVAKVNSLPQKLDDLVALGLIRIYVTGHKNAQVVTITDKGREVAKFIREIVDILQNDGEAPNGGGGPDLPDVIKFTHFSFRDSRLFARA